MLFAKSRHDALRARRLVEAFDGPAAVADAEGLIAANAAWRDRHADRPPEAALDGALPDAGGLYRLVRAARAGEARIETGPDGSVRVGPLGHGASLWVQDAGGSPAVRRRQPAGGALRGLHAGRWSAGAGRGDRAQRRLRPSGRPGLCGSHA
jgi:hypothetical protein